MKCASITLPWHRGAAAGRGVFSRAWLAASALIGLAVCLPFVIIILEVFSHPLSHWLRLLSPLNLHYLSNTVVLYDYSCTPEASRETAARIPGAELTIMAGLGHFPMTEDPEKFRGYLLPVLDRIADGR